jgi:hypothetical protein
MWKVDSDMGTIKYLIDRINQTFSKCQIFDYISFEIVIFLAVWAEAFSATTVD